MYSIGHYLKGGRLFDSFTCYIFLLLPGEPSQKSDTCFNSLKPWQDCRLKINYYGNLRCSLWMYSLLLGKTVICTIICAKYAHLRISNEKCKVNVLIYTLHIFLRTKNYVLITRDLHLEIYIQRFKYSRLSKSINLERSLLI